MKTSEIAKEARRLAGTLGTLGPDASRALEAKAGEFEGELGIAQRSGLAVSTRLLYIASRAESLNRVGLEPNK